MDIETSKVGGTISERALRRLKLAVKVGSVALVASKIGVSRQYLNKVIKTESLTLWLVERIEELYGPI